MRQTYLVSSIFYSLYLPYHILQLSPSTAPDQEISELLPRSSYYDDDFDECEMARVTCPSFGASLIVNRVEQEHGLQECDWHDCPVYGHKDTVFG